MPHVQSQRTFIPQNQERNGVTEATPFLRKSDISFLCPPPNRAGDFLMYVYLWLIWLIWAYTTSAVRKNCSVAPS